MVYKAVCFPQPELTHVTLPHRQVLNAGVDNMAAIGGDIRDFYLWMLEKGDPRVESWPLMSSPIPISIIVVLYLGLVKLGPRFMQSFQPLNLRKPIIFYNFCLVLLSAYMFQEFLVTSILSGYSYVCQPVDYSNDPLALRMTRVCWWYFFSKIIEIIDTIFFILRKKNNQISFLHVYHHSTMIINWWLGVKYIAGGQSWFLAMFNCAVHVLMYTYYMLAACGIDRSYLWWKKYLTSFQLTQFVAVIVHTSINMFSDCPFPQGFNYAVVIYSISLILLFSNFYLKTYDKPEKNKSKYDSIDNAIIYQNGSIEVNECYVNSNVSQRHHWRKLN